MKTMYEIMDQFEFSENDKVTFPKEFYNSLSKIDKIEFSGWLKDIFKNDVVKIFLFDKSEFILTWNLLKIEQLIQIDNKQKYKRSYLRHHENRMPVFNMKTKQWYKLKFNDIKKLEVI